MIMSTVMLVRFSIFFKHIVDFEDGPVEHNLAYVRWYKPAETSKVRYYFSIDDDEETCNVELWKNEYMRSEEHTSELQSRSDLVCRLLLEKKKKKSRRLLHADAQRTDYPPPPVRQPRGRATEHQLAQHVPSRRVARQEPRAAGPGCRHTP